MATVIDSLVVELGLDATKMTSGQQDQLRQLRTFEDQAVRAGKAIELQQSRMAGTLNSIKREALSIITLLLGGRGLSEMVQHVTSLDASTFRLAKTMDMSAAETSKWQGAIKEAGGSAEGANAALSGLSSEMSRFQLTGESQMLPVLSRLQISLYDQNRNLKSSGQLWLELADAVRGMDPREATAFLQMIPGANQDMINFALLGRKAMEEYLESARLAGVTTEESARQALEYQRALSLVDTAATNLGRTLITIAGPALTTTLDAVRNILISIAGGPGAAQADAENRSLSGRLQRGIYNWTRGLIGLSPVAEDPLGFERRGGYELLAARMRMSTAGRPAADTNEVTNYIRAAAVKRGIDPEVAIAVARSEGLNNYIGDRGSSFGPFQLHYGGIAGGGMAVGGLGDEFTRRTGLDARNPATWKSQVDFSLDEAARGGWGPWHGWRGDPRAGLGGGGGGSTTVNVGDVNVVVPPGTDGAGVGNAVVSTIKRGLDAASANNGLR